MTMFAFIFLVSAFLSVWIARDIKIWGTLLALCLFCGIVAGHIEMIGMAYILCLALLWSLYLKRPTLSVFTALCLLGIAYKLKLIPGYNPYTVTQKFTPGLENPLIGLFPLALIIPLSRSWLDWKDAFKGVALGCLGIGFIAFLASLSGVVRWDLTIPPFMALRTLSNLFLTSIPEEAFYRGFIQNKLSRYFQDIKWGKVLALVLTSIIFTATHIFWSPNIGVLIFTFVASLLYGGVYLYSRRIESAMLVHFILNLIHMSFFSYHAT